jgi:hypothetical protein
MRDLRVERVIGPDGQARAVLLSIEDYRSLVQRIQELERSATERPSRGSGEAPGATTEVAWTAEALAAWERLEEGLYDSNGAASARDHDDVIYEDLS